VGLSSRRFSPLSFSTKVVPPPPMRINAFFSEKVRLLKQPRFFFFGGRGPSFLDPPFFQLEPKPLPLSFGLGPFQFFVGKMRSSPLRFDDVPFPRADLVFSLLKVMSRSYYNLLTEL